MVAQWSDPVGIVAQGESGCNGDGKANTASAATKTTAMARRREGRREEEDMLKYSSRLAWRYRG